MLNIMQSIYLIIMAGGYFVLSFSHIHTHIHTRIYIYIVLIRICRQDACTEGGMLNRPASEKWTDHNTIQIYIIKWLIVDGELQDFPNERTRIFIQHFYETMNSTPAYKKLKYISIYILVKIRTQARWSASLYHEFVHVCAHFGWICGATDLLLYICYMCYVLCVISIESGAQMKSNKLESIATSLLDDRRIGTRTNIRHSIYIHAHMHTAGHITCPWRHRSSVYTFILCRICCLVA